MASAGLQKRDLDPENSKSSTNSSGRGFNCEGPGRGMSHVLCTFGWVQAHLIAEIAEMLRPLFCYYLKSTTGHNQGPRILQEWFHMLMLQLVGRSCHQNTYQNGKT